MLIERMTILDFLGKVQSQRLGDQLHKMRQVTRDYFILLENPWMLKRTKWNLKSVVGLVASIAEHNRILISVNMDWSLYFVLYYYNKYTSDRSLFKNETRAKPKQMTPKDQAVYALAGLTGIQDVTALKLLMHFGTLRQLAKAKFEDLSLVCNTKVAQNIFDVFNVNFMQ